MKQRRKAIAVRSVVFKPELLERLDAAAAADQRSRSAFIRLAVEHELTRLQQREVDR